MKDILRDHPALKLMDVVAERDAAIAERDIAMAEKRTVYAERDSALIQRDVAYADRNAAWMQRDAAKAALSIVISGKDSSEAVSKLMQMLNMSAIPIPCERPIPGTKSGKMLDQAKEKQLGKKSASSLKKRKSPVPLVMGENKITNSKNRIAKGKGGSKSSKKAKLEQGTNENAKKRRAEKSGTQVSLEIGKLDGKKGLKGKTCSGGKSDEIVPFDSVLASSISIPYCSCTGSNQQCYRWGKGGWQSACCTNFLSMYPLPLNPAKRSSRVPGRKMSGGAFQKLLQRLASEHVDITAPIDLVNYWAKHGTNRYVTIK
jgi:hypothetical protein